jgi:signal transduction histidine kinase
MSLRLRLAIVLALGLSALLFAALAVTQILSGTQAGRERAAEAETEAAAQALADAYPARADVSSVERGGGHDIRRQLHQTAASVMRPVPNSAGGYCTVDGMMITGSTHDRPDPRGEGGPQRLHPLSQDLESAVSQLCRIARSKESTQARVEHRRDVDLIRATPIRDGAVAWALVRVRAQETPAFTASTVALAVAALLLVGFTLEATFTLGRGVASLRTALARLSEDLRAPVPRPRARELADIARGLEALAARLSEARERERDLAGSLAREQRLAGLGRVAAGVAHEVRNPLAGMKLRLDLLKREKMLSPEAREDVAVCLGEVARLDRLVESLLSVGRVKNKPDLEIDLAKLADARVAAAAGAASKKSLRLVREGGAAIPSEPDAVNSAVENLLRNAIEASPEGGVVVVRIGQGERSATLDVEDQGPGILDERKNELFEPFFTTKPEGTGLGLWMSRLLLEARGASLRYDRIGDLTRMRIEFPRA